MSGGLVGVHASGSGGNTSVFSGGTLSVALGGTDSVDRIENGGKDFVFGLTVLDVVSSGGTQVIESGGSAGLDAVDAGGIQTVSHGGVSDVTFVYGTRYLYGVASGDVVSGDPGQSIRRERRLGRERRPERVRLPVRVERRLRQRDNRQRHDRSVGRVRRFRTVHRRPQRRPDGIGFRRDRRRADGVRGRHAGRSWGADQRQHRRRHCQRVSPSATRPIPTPWSCGPAGSPTM